MRIDYRTQRQFRLGQLKRALGATVLAGRADEVGDQRISGLKTLERCAGGLWTAVAGAGVGVGAGVTVGVGVGVGG